MRSVLISIQPKWVEKICKKIGEENGKPIYKKRIEVRKGKPNEPTPIKCLIYCTYGQLLYADYPNGAQSKVIKLGDYKVSGKDKISNMLNGKVIGEFVCDKIDEYTAEFVNDNDCYEDIRRRFFDDDGEEDYELITSNSRDNPEDCELLKNSCLTYAELKKYIGENFHDIPFYGWHISDLKIYDKPKELSEFKAVKVIRRYQKKEYNKFDKLSHSHRVEVKYLERPPQSWCYVESLGE